MNNIIIELVCDRPIGTHASEFHASDSMVTSTISFGINCPHYLQLAEPLPNNPISLNTHSFDYREWCEQVEADSTSGSNDADGLSQQVYRGVEAGRLARRSLSIPCTGSHTGDAASAMSMLITHTYPAQISLPYFLGWCISIRLGRELKFSLRLQGAEADLVSSHLPDFATDESISPSVT